MFKTIINWLLWSSQDPEKLSLTVTGLIISATSYIIWLAAISPLHLVLGAAQISEQAVIIGGAAGALATLVGFIRKFFFLLKPSAPAPAPLPPAGS